MRKERNCISFINLVATLYLALSVCLSILWSVSLTLISWRFWTLSLYSAFLCQFTLLIPVFCEWIYLSILFIFFIFFFGFEPPLADWLAANFPTNQLSQLRLQQIHSEPISFYDPVPPTVLCSFRFLHPAFSRSRKLGKTQ